MGIWGRVKRTARRVYSKTKTAVKKVATTVSRIRSTSKAVTRAAKTVAKKAITTAAKKAITRVTSAASKAVSVARKATSRARKVTKDVRAAVTTAAKETAIKVAAKASAEAKRQASIAKTVVEGAKKTVEKAKAVLPKAPIVVTKVPTVKEVPTVIKKPRRIPIRERVGPTLVAAERLREEREKKLDEQKEKLKEITLPKEYIPTIQETIKRPTVVSEKLVLEKPKKVTFLEAPFIIETKEKTRKIIKDIWEKLKKRSKEMEKKKKELEEKTKGKKITFLDIPIISKIKTALGEEIKKEWEKSKDVAEKGFEIAKDLTGKAKEKMIDLAESASILAEKLEKDFSKVVKMDIKEVPKVPTPTPSPYRVGPTITAAQEKEAQDMRDKLKVALSPAPVIVPTTLPVKKVLTQKELDILEAAKYDEKLRQTPMYKHLMKKLLPYEEEPKPETYETIEQKYKMGMFEPGWKFKPLIGVGETYSEALAKKQKEYEEQQEKIQKEMQKNLSKVGLTTSGMQGLSPEERAKMQAQWHKITSSYPGQMITSIGKDISKIPGLVFTTAGYVVKITADQLKSYVEGYKQIADLFKKQTKIVPFEYWGKSSKKYGTVSKKGIVLISPEEWKKPSTTMLMGPVEGIKELKESADIAWADNAQARLKIRENEKLLSETIPKNEAVERIKNIDPTAVQNYDNYYNEIEPVVRQINYTAKLARTLNEEAEQLAEDAKKVKTQEEADEWYRKRDNWQRRWDQNEKNNTYMNNLYIRVNKKYPNAEKRIKSQIDAFKSIGLKDELDWEKHNNKINKINKNFEDIKALGGGLTTTGDVLKRKNKSAYFAYAFGKSFAKTAAELYALGIVLKPLVGAGKVLKGVKWIKSLKKATAATKLGKLALKYPARTALLGQQAMSIGFSGMPFVKEYKKEGLLTAGARFAGRYAGWQLMTLPSIFKYSAKLSKIKKLTKVENIKIHRSISEHLGQELNFNAAKNDLMKQGLNSKQADSIIKYIKMNKAVTVFETVGVPDPLKTKTYSLTKSQLQGILGKSAKLKSLSVSFKMHPVTKRIYGLKFYNVDQIIKKELSELHLHVVEMQFHPTVSKKLDKIGVDAFYKTLKYTGKTPVGIQAARNSATNLINSAVYSKQQFLMQINTIKDPKIKDIAIKLSKVKLVKVPKRTLALKEPKYLLGEYPDFYKLKRYYPTQEIYRRTEFEMYDQKYLKDWFKSLEIKYPTKVYTGVEAVKYAKLGVQYPDWGWGVYKGYGVGAIQKPTYFAKIEKIPKKYIKKFIDFKALLGTTPSPSVTTDQGLIMQQIVTPTTKTYLKDMQAGLDKLFGVKFKKEVTKKAADIARRAAAKLGFQWGVSTPGIVYGTKEAMKFYAYPVREAELIKRMPKKVPLKPVVDVWGDLVVAPDVIVGPPTDIWGETKLGIDFEDVFGTIDSGKYRERVRGITITEPIGVVKPKKEHKEVPIYRPTVDIWPSVKPGVKPKMTQAQLQAQQQAQLQMQQMQDILIPTYPAISRISPLPPPIIPFVPFGFPKWKKKEKRLTRGEIKRKKEHAKWLAKYQASVGAVMLGMPKITRGQAEELMRKKAIAGLRIRPEIKMSPSETATEYSKNLNRFFAQGMSVIKGKKKKKKEKKKGKYANEYFKNFNKMFVGNEFALKKEGVIKKNNYAKEYEKNLQKVFA